MSATCSPSPARICSEPAAPAEVDRSCRWPVLLLFGIAAIWLLAASTLALTAGLKFHGPQLLAGSAWLTYGRLQPAAAHALLYGFAVPAGLAATLWLVARLGRVPLRLPGAAAAGAGLWCAGVLLGLIGILAGDGTGYEWLEIPGYAAPLLLGGYGLVAISALVTFRDRRQGRLYVSQWFLLAALFWFPWVFTTAAALVILAPLRGVMPAAVAWWYAAHLSQVWFGFVGLAILFYLLPVLLDRPLYSQYHALLAFWLLLLFGGGSGTPQSAPLPAWMPALSTVCSLFTLVAVVAVALNFYRTLTPVRAGKTAFPIGLVLFSAAAYVLAGLLNAGAALPAVAAITDFTLITPARTQGFVYGFYAMAVFAALYYILPRVLGFELPSRALRTLHVGGAMAGIALWTVSLVVGGALQGRILNRPDAAFLEALRPGLMALRLASLGDCLMWLAHAALVLNLSRGLVGWCRRSCVPVLLAASRPEVEEIAKRDAVEAAR